MIKSCNQTDHSIASGLSTPFFFTPRRSGRGVPCAGWWLTWSHLQAQPRFIVPGRLTALRHVFIGAAEPPLPRHLQSELQLPRIKCRRRFLCAVPSWIHVRDVKAVDE